MITARCKYNINECAFQDLDDPDVLYWLGFLFADGNIHYSASGHGKLTVQLCDKDIGHLEKLKVFLQFTGPIGRYPRLNGRTGRIDHEVSLQVYCDPLCESLVKLGLVPKKSLIVDPPAFLYQSRDFWRGIIDGDGNLGITSTHVLGVCGTKVVCENFKIYSDQIVPQSSVRVAPAANIFRVTYGGVYARALATHFYQEGDLALDRKTEIALQWQLFQGCNKAVSQNTIRALREDFDSKQYQLKQLVEKYNLSGQVIRGIVTKQTYRVNV